MMITKEFLLNKIANGEKTCRLSLLYGKCLCCKVFAMDLIRSHCYAFTLIEKGEESLDTIAEKMVLAFDKVLISTREDMIEQGKDLCGHVTKMKELIERVKDKATDE